MKTRLEIWIDVSQRRDLQHLADKKKVSMAALVRDALTALLDREKAKVTK